MTDEHTMQDLIERLESATGPDRELDALVAIAMGEPPSEAFRLAGAPDPGKFGVGSYGYWTAPKYSESIDAALTLVPEGWQWQISNRAPDPHTGRAYLNNKQLINIGGGLTPNPRYAGAEATAATPAIALCIAALRARQK